MVNFDLPDELPGEPEEGLLEVVLRKSVSMIRSLQSRL